MKAIISSAHLDKSLLVMAISVLLFSIFAFSIPVFAQNIPQYCTTTGSYQVCTDQSDYSPTLTVHISGSGFVPDSTYLIKVTRPDTTVVTGDGSFGAWPTSYDYVVSDSNGNFLFNYVLDGIIGTYKIEVLDSENNVVATHTFTDKIDTATTLNSITTPLTAGQTNVAFSGQVTNSGTGETVQLHYAATCLTDKTQGTILATALTTGSSTSSKPYSGTFTAPSSGTYQFWAYYVGNSGHNPSSSDCQTITVNAPKSNQTITVNTHALSTTTYGSTFSVSATASSGLDVAITSSGVCSGSGTNSATITMNSGTGTCTIYYNQAGDSTHNPAPQMTENTNAQKADAIIVVNSYSVTYDGNSHTATGSATGVNSESLTLDLSATTHTNAGDYSDAWNFAGDANYNAASGTANDSIAKADAIISVTSYDVSYDGNPHAATGSATGAKGESLSGLDLSLTTHTDANDYPTDAWTFTDVTGNYNDAAGTVHDSIGKIDATIVVTPYDVIYDGSAHTATGTATGAKGEDLGSLLDISGTTHTDANVYTDSWTFAGDSNYNSDSGTVSDSITKADAVIVVTPYSLTYDANSHTATGSAKGVLNENLAGLDLSGTTHTNAGTFIDTWTFVDTTGNYNDASGIIGDSIAKADATINVVGYTGVYDANAHGASGTATGIGGVDLTGSLDLGFSFTNATGGTAHWTFTGGTNYKNASGDVSIVITKADATIIVTPYSVTYDGNAHIATGTATGIKSESLTGLNLTNTTHTNAGTYTDTWTFTDVTGNYNNASDIVNDKINSVSAPVIGGGPAPSAGITSQNTSTHSPGATSEVIVQNGKVTLRYASIVVDSVCKETVTPTYMEQINPNASATFTVNFDCTGVPYGNYPVTYSLQLLSGKIIASQTYNLTVKASGVSAPSIIILATVSPELTSGQTGTVVITVQNSGNSSTNGNITLSVPTGLSVTPLNIPISLNPGEIKNVSFSVTASNTAGIPMGLGVLTGFASFFGMDMPSSAKLNVSVNYQTETGFDTVSKPVDINIIPRFPFIVLVAAIIIAGLAYYFFYYKKPKQETKQETNQ